MVWGTCRYTCCPNQSKIEGGDSIWTRPNKQTDGQTAGQMAEQTNRRTNSRTDRVLDFNIDCKIKKVLQCPKSNKGRVSNKSIGGRKKSKN